MAKEAIEGGLTDVQEEVDGSSNLVTAIIVIVVTTLIMFVPIIVYFKCIQPKNKKKITDEPKPVPLENIATLGDMETMTAKGDGQGNVSQITMGQDASTLELKDYDEKQK